MSDDLFDFGFTAVTEEELEAVQEAKEKVESTTSSVSELEDKLERLYNAVQPLLNNLRANPEKDYIYWPNRADKVDQFRDRLDKIYEG